MQTSITLTLDTRQLRKGDKYTIILRLGHFQRTTSISTGHSVSTEFWDENKRKVKNKYKGVSSVNILNQLLSEELAKARDIINKLHLNGQLNFLSITQLKNKIVKKNKFDSFYEFGSKLEKDLRAANRIGTANSYKDLINRLKTFTNKRDLKFNEVNYDFIKQFDHFHLSHKGNSLNGLASYLRTLRAIYNKGILANLVDEEGYPFKNYKIRTSPTSKRAIESKHVKKILLLTLDEGSWPFHYRNYFLISYMLFGMSFIDMAFLKRKNIMDGRVKFQRKKTSKTYDIKITEQLKVLLEFYLKGKTKEEFIFPVINSDNLEMQYKQVRGARKRYNLGLRNIAELCDIEDHLTSYVSRHSFATHALLKNVPLPAISAMLGHNKLTTTQIYLKSLPTGVLDKYQEQLNI